jgi:glycosyltransferase involved in cell wall biosynthesis
MQIVIVSDYGHISGGAARVAIVSARALAEQGHQVSFVCAVGPVDPALRRPNVRVHHLNLRDVWTDRNSARAALRGIWNLAAARHLASLLTTFSRENTVVHFHQWTKAFSPSAIAAAARAQLRCVFTLHDYFLFCPNGLYFDRADARPCHRRPLSTSCLVAACDSRSRAHKAVRLARQVASDRILRETQVPLNLIHVSDFARDVARPFFPDSARHFVVPNPVTLPERPPAPVRDNDAFVFLGRFTAEKGVLVFADAARAAGVRAVLLGAGPELDCIRRTAPQAEILPWGTDSVVEQTLGRARALVFPSLWYETSGLTALEALSRGVPVVCSRTTGAADWIEDGANGFLVDLGNSAALQARLRRLRDDRDLAEVMGRCAYARYWRGTPTAARHAERLDECYRMILE